VVRIVTDSTADLSETQQQSAGITVVPLNVRFGDQVIKDHVELSGDEFFAKLKASSQLPKTSQPAVGEFESVFRRHLDCLLYTSPSPRDLSTSRMPSSA